jgi:hypothetical protein
MDGNIVDLGGATKRAACGKSLSVVGGHVEGCGRAGVEIVVVLLITGNESSGR